MKIIPAITAFLLISTFLPGNTQAECSAQSEGADSDKTYPCTLCRTGNLRDYYHFGYNQVYGSLSWMNAPTAASFYVENSFGETVRIEIDIQFTGFGVSIPWITWDGDSISLALPFGADGMDIHVTVIFETGDQDSATFNTENVPDYFQINGQTPEGIGAEDAICDEEDNTEEDDYEPTTGLGDEGFGSGLDDGGGAPDSGGLEIPENWSPLTCGVSTVGGDDSTARTTCIRR